MHEMFEEIDINRRRMLFLLLLLLFVVRLLFDNIQRKQSEKVQVWARDEGEGEGERSDITLGSHRRNEMDAHFFRNRIDSHLSAP